MTAIDPAWLDAARKELAGREADPQWPAEDTAAWRDIVLLLDGNTLMLRDDEEPGPVWERMLLAARAAEDRRCTAYGEAAVDDPKRLTIARRIVALANIRRILERAARHVGQCLPSMEPAL